MDINAKKIFFSLVLPLAEDEQQRSSISPLITITQAAHESAWGTSELTTKANNLFGFTGEKWESEGKPIIKLPTEEWLHGSIDTTSGVTIPGKWITVERPFRSYGSWAESIRDWAALMQKPIYEKAFEAAKSGDLTGFSIEVSMAGYATDPNYSSALIGVGNIVKDLFEGIA